MASHPLFFFFQRSHPLLRVLYTTHKLVQGVNAGKGTYPDTVSVKIFQTQQNKKTNPDEWQGTDCNDVNVNAGKGTRCSSSY